MFSIGKAEAIDSSSCGLVRNSIVWLGQPCGETTKGLPATHPLCGVLLRIIEQADFIGTWLMCREVSIMRKFEQQTLLSRLNGSAWTIDSEQSEAIRAHRTVRVDSPWPFDSGPALPWPQFEILVIGCRVDYETIDCLDEGDWRPQWAVRGDGLVIRSRLARQLAVERGYAISIGRTHTDNSPGLSVLGPEGWFDPELLVRRDEIVGVHRGGDASRAWSYGRVNQQ